LPDDHVKGMATRMISEEVTILRRDRTLRLKKGDSRSALDAPFFPKLQEGNRGTEKIVGFFPQHALIRHAAITLSMQSRTSDAQGPLHPCHHPRHFVLLLRGI